MSSNEFRDILTKIHKQITEKRSELERQASELPNYLQIIQEKERNVQDLQKAFQEIRFHTDYYHSKIEETKMEKIRYGKLANQIEQLTKKIHDFNKMSSINPSELAPLSPENEKEILNHLEKVKKLLFESTLLDYDQEIDHLYKISDFLNREISILKLAKAKNLPFDDNFNLLLTNPDFFPQEQRNSTTDFLPSHSEMHPVRNSSFDLIKNKNSMNDSIIFQERSGKIRNNIQLQYEALKQIRDLINQNPVQITGKSRIYQIFQNRIHQMREIGPIQSIKIATIESIQKSYSDLSTKIESFQNFLNEIHKQNTFSQVQSFEIPDFKNQVLPCYKKKYRVDSSLEKLIETAKSIIELINPKNQSLSIQFTQQMKQARCYLAKSYSKHQIDSTRSPSASTSNLTDILDENEYQIDNSAVDKLKETASRKLPDNFLKNFGQNRLAVDIPNLEANIQPEVKDDLLNFDFHEDFDNNTKFEQRLSYTNTLLRSLISTPNKRIPTLKFPRVSDTEEFEKPNFDAFLESFQKVLSPEQQTIEFLKDEIQRIQKDIDAVTSQLNRKLITDDAEDTVESVEKENQDLLSQLERNETMLNDLTQEIEKKNEQIEELELENQLIDDQVRNCEITKEMELEKEKEFEEKKEKFEQAKKDYEKARELYDLLLQKE